MRQKFIYLKRVEEGIQKGRTYPYDLYLATDDRRDFICIGEGTGHGSVGGSMTPAEFVSGRWDEYIERFSAGWMKELILKIGVENINQTDIIDYWKSHDV